MQIRHFRIHSFAISDPPLRSSFGLHAPLALRTVIELESADGVIGIAETHGGSGPAETLESLRPQVIGQDASQLMASLTALRSQSKYRTALSALEVAALDLVGKTVGLPVHALLGGKVREEVPFSAYAFYKHAWGESKYGEALTPEGLVTQVQELIADYGFGSVKLKAGVLEPDQEIETIRLLRQTLGPTVPLRIDPNCVWSVATSVRVGKALQAELSDGGYLEDPAEGMADMAAVRAGLLAEGIDMPLASNMAVVSFETLAEAHKTDACQVVLGDHHYWGGLRAVAALGRVCETLGVGLSMHSNSHLGVSLMAMAHVAAATPQLSYACDTHYPWQSADEEIVAEGRIPIVGGNVRVSDAPGLGVTLNYDTLARLKERYEASPIRARDDVAEMHQHVDPHWQRRRW
ncbi:enolase C-terminal domain-like protein [Armatimonas rosea]|uniref:glucarate dehydratase n=1 Tax=Armatimonas rosea TaxID=685828 RepID=A0A7W9W9S0_ARMRO|nr:enolase C-terminal domain-like protein [Armatimonas rosea]MBB6052847.1 glucarate dehydratase [Armatimonas rosea]